MTLIPADHVWAMWAALFSIAALGLWAEHSAWGARLSGAVITILLACALSNAGVLPSTAAVYNDVWTYLVPFAIPLLLMRANLRSIPRELSLTLAAFALGVLATAAGAVAAFYIVDANTQGARLAGVFAAAYIGGPLNIPSVGQGLGVRADVLLMAVVAASNVVLAGYLLLIFLLPSWRALRERFHEPLTDERWSRTDRIVLSEHRKGSNMSPSGITTALAVSAVICAAAYALAPHLPFAGGAILLIALFSIVLATLLPKHLGSLGAAEDLGMMMMFLLFAVIGASANVSAIMQINAELLWFAAVIVVVHLLIIMLLGKLLRMSLPQVLIASNANIGGVGTAVAMAASRRWRALEVPAVLCGVLGYALAVPLGLLLGRWLGA